MNVKRSLLALGAVSAITLAGLGANGLASAQSSDGMSSLVDKLASRFNLDKSEVQKVFEEDRAAHKAEHEQKAQERLAQAVTDGKLTQEQADALSAKRNELKEFMDGKRGDRSEENRAAVKEKMDEFRKWLEDNNIPDEFARGGPRHMKGGPRMEMREE